MLYDFALRNDDGTLDMVRTGYDLDFEATGDTVPSDDPQHVVIAPGGTVQLTVVRVLPTYVLESGTWWLVPTGRRLPVLPGLLLGGDLAARRFTRAPATRPAGSSLPPLTHELPGARRTYRE